MLNGVKHLPEEDSSLTLRMTGKVGCFEDPSLTLRMTKEVLSTR